jgi:L-threonylcarbamoyladenylate synthase
MYVSSSCALSKLIAAINAGEVVILPTDTVYALAADASNKKAIDKIYKIKRRKRNKPLAVLVDSVKVASKIAFVSQKAAEILHNSSLAPITLVLPYKFNRLIASNLNYKTNSIGLRIPNDKFILKLLRSLKRPLAATSVNISGCQYIDDIYGIPYFIKEKVKVIVKGGKIMNIPSAIVDISQSKFNIIRKGKITKNKKIFNYFNIP